MTARWLRRRSLLVLSSAAEGPDPRQRGSRKAQQLVTRYAQHATARRQHARYPQPGARGQHLNTRFNSSRISRLKPVKRLNGRVR